MQPHNPMLDTYRKLAGDVVALTSPLLTKSYLVSENEKDSPALSRAKSEWSPIPRLLKDIDESLVDLGERVFRIALDDRLTEDARAQDISTTAGVIGASIAAKSDDVTQRATKILETLREAAYPARPEPADVTQEARIAGLKADLRMVWDSAADGDEIVKAMAGSLRRSIGDGDALSTWLIASTHWPEDYLQARNTPHHAEVWALRVAEILDTMSPANLSEARRTYRTLADGRNGLPLLNVLFAQLARIVEDIARWRPTSQGTTPWTRVS